MQHAIPNVCVLAILSMVFLTMLTQRELSWLFEELQLDEVMVFVAKLVTFLVVCGICSVTTGAVSLLP